MGTKCPKCGKEMKIVREDVSNNAKKDKDYKEYKRSVYWCELDDVWVNIEIPK
ncbi:MAG: hypothetical protein US39_C0023G0007 [Microgenomates group bacterium GW2011_GWC1_37_12b]|uniref:Uncharacterized protein n=1 Tax=Candidatus Woesebacteria bacterium GW2011_GWB1_38_8b TaxID=1618571 RepID=A0A0G0L2D1_9BACT|nr:MAG: hypothetical protein US39_C0023G0007 [Microgenomates group bacterium GW2011_GWC1_37_12b]KKQ86103.1 MAG: hypothetical protein UT10_C0032G0008 [Candidatus Woesebacteria bacterium GW2011_GWB1_38_8b]